LVLAAAHHMQMSKVLKHNLPNSAGFVAGLLLGLRS
jgi:uncharacterized membrane protein (Fun14 family)